MSELDKFISRVKQLDSQNAKETSFDVKFPVKVVNEIPNNQLLRKKLYTQAVVLKINESNRYNSQTNGTSESFGEKTVAITNSLSMR